MATGQCIAATARLGGYVRRARRGGHAALRAAGNADGAAGVGVEVYGRGARGSGVAG